MNGDGRDRVGESRSNHCGLRWWYVVYFISFILFCIVDGVWCVVDGGNERVVLFDVVVVVLSHRFGFLSLVFYGMGGMGWWGKVSVGISLPLKGVYIYL